MSDLVIATLLDVSSMGDMQFLGQLASTGVVGVLLVITLLALRDKDRQLKAEMNARIEDAKTFNGLAMSLQREVIHAISKLGEMLEIWERREETQDRDRSKPRGGVR